MLGTLVLVAALWGAAALLFLLLGPVTLVGNRLRKGESAPSESLIFWLTILTLPTLVGWPVVLAYALFGKGK